MPMRLCTNPAPSSRARAPTRAATSRRSVNSRARSTKSAAASAPAITPGQRQPAARLPTLTCVSSPDRAARRSSPLPPSARSGEASRAAPLAPSVSAAAPTATSANRAFPFGSIVQREAPTPSGPGATTCTMRLASFGRIATAPGRVICAINVALSFFTLYTRTPSRPATYSRGPSNQSTVAAVIAPPSIGDDRLSAKSFAA